MSGGFEHVKLYIVRRIGSIELEVVVMYRSRLDPMNVSCHGSFPAENRTYPVTLIHNIY